jgi:primase-polymerase (primpol)-like protein
MCTLPPIGRKSEGLEMYCDKRFFVVTGRHVAGTPKGIKAGRRR